MFQIDRELDPREAIIVVRFKRAEEGVKKGTLIRYQDPQSENGVSEELFTSFCSLFLFLDPLLSARGFARPEEPPSLENGSIRRFWRQVKWSLLFLAETYSDFSGLYEIFWWDKSFRREVLRRVRYCKVEWRDLFEEIYEGFLNLRQPVDEEWWAATLDLCRTLRDPKYFFFWDKFVSELDEKGDHPVVKGMREVARDIWMELHETLTLREMEIARSSIPMSAPSEWLPSSFIPHVFVQP